MYPGCGGILRGQFLFYFLLELAGAASGSVLKLISFNLCVQYNFELESTKSCGSGSLLILAQCETETDYLLYSLQHPRSVGFMQEPHSSSQLQQNVPPAC